MVNYSQMESVWRSYGPLDPIGSEAPKARSSRAPLIVAGVAGVCVAGALGGLYLRPDLGAAAASSPAPGVSQGPEITRVSQAAPVAGEAARLQTQLQMLIVDGPVGPSPLESSPLAPPLAVSEPSLEPSGSAPRDLQAAPTLDLPASAPPSDKLAGRPLQGMVPARTPVRAPGSGLSNAGRGEGAPLVLASRAPTPTTYPRWTPRTTPAPRPAPPQTAAAQTAPPPSQPEGPSYDCRHAGTAAERMICESPELASLDRKLAVELDAAVAAGHSRQELARDQEHWRRRRETAAPDPRAVADVYRRRIGQLRSMQ